MRCLCCGKEIAEQTELQDGWHKRCVRSFFGVDDLPRINVTEKELEDLANACVAQGLTVPGVQKKLSLHLSQDPDARLTLADHPTGYILKPQTEDCSHLPEAGPSNP